MKLKNSITSVLVALVTVVAQGASGETIHATVVKMSSSGFAAVQISGTTSYSDPALSSESGFQIWDDIKRYSADSDQRLPFAIQDLNDALRKLPSFLGITVLPIAGVSYKLRKVEPYVIIWPYAPPSHAGDKEPVKPAPLP